MVDEVILNDVPLQVTDFLSETVKDSEGKEVRKVSFNFKVTHSEYHDITTLLYQMVFDLKIPQSNEEFRAEIFNYATSVTNLYEENAVGDFSLVLLEVTVRNDCIASLVKIWVTVYNNSDDHSIHMRWYFA